MPDFISTHWVTFLSAAGFVLVVLVGRWLATRPLVDGQVEDADIARRSINRWSWRILVLGLIVFGAILIRAATYEIPKKELDNSGTQDMIDRTDDLTKKYNLDNDNKDK